MHSYEVVEHLCDDSKSTEGGRGRGGKDFLLLSYSRMSVEEIIERVKDPGAGGISVFCGTTREHFQQRKVVLLEYEAYVPMAVKELKSICREIRARWRVFNVFFFHRLGEVRVTEESVVIAVSSEHRKECLEAVEFAIDSLKANVPIWKREVYEGGEEYKGDVNSTCPASASANNTLAEEKVKFQWKSNPEFIETHLNKTKATTTGEI